MRQKVGKAQWHALAPFLGVDGTSQRRNEISQRIRLSSRSRPSQIHYQTTRKLTVRAGEVCTRKDHTRMYPTSECRRGLRRHAEMLRARFSAVPVPAANALGALTEPNSNLSSRNVGHIAIDGEARDERVHFISAGKTRVGDRGITQRVTNSIVWDREHHLPLSTSLLLGKTAPR